MLNSVQYISCFAPAKANLLLRVTGRLGNGYHRLYTLICPLSLHDELCIEINPNCAEISCELSFSPELERHFRISGIFDRVHRDLSSDSNLVLRALRRVFQEFGLEGKRGATLRLLKRIPVQAGLGGGSADAAALLRAMSKVLGQEGDLAVFYQIAAELGSDVPAIFHGGLVFAHNMGEKLCEVESVEHGDVLGSLSDLGVVLVKPSIGVSTAAAYSSLGFGEAEELEGPDAEKVETFSWPDVDLEQAREDLLNMGLCLRPPAEFGAKNGEMLTFQRQEGISGLPGFVPTGQRLLRSFVNDFEPVVFSEYPEMSEVTSALDKVGVSRVLLAGSGSSVLGLVADRKEASAVVEALRKFAPEDWFISEISLKPVNALESGIFDGR